MKDEWDGWKDIARTFGYMFFGIGLILLVLIVVAMTIAPAALGTGER